MRESIRRFGLVCLCFALFGACSSSSSSAGPQTFGGADCTQCVNDACSAERTACEGDSACSTFEACLYACPSGSTANGACAHRCALPTGASGTAALDGLFACGARASLGASCSTRCKAENGWSDAPHVGPSGPADGGTEEGGATTPDGGSDSGGATGTYADSPCGKCVATTACSSQYATCLGIADCATWAACVGKCPLQGKNVSLTCLNACAAPTSTAGKSARDATYNCALSASSGTCSASCQ